MDKRRKCRRVTTLLREQVGAILLKEVQKAAASYVAATTTTLGFPACLTAASGKKKSLASLARDLEIQFFKEHGERDVDYLHQVQTLTSALTEHGRSLLEAAHFSSKGLSKCDWDAHVIKQHRPEPEKDEIPEPHDPTRKPLEEIYQELELNEEAQLIQCHKCKSWNVAYKTIQLRALDEPGTTKCMCRNCKHNWTEHS